MMGTKLRDRLQMAHQQRFVGRTSELELFQRLLSREIDDVAVLHIYGPGGIGKTTLLNEFERRAQESRRTVLTLDGRNVEPSPTGFFLAIQVELHLPADQPILAAVSAIPDLVLFIDTYELITPLDAWLREEFLPQLSDQSIVVIAGRHTPSDAWRTDTGWGALTRIISLRNLRPEESKAYLLARGVRGDQLATVLEMTYGHPLALSLAADIVSQRSDAQPFDLQRDPNIVRVLLERFVADVPTPSFRQALEICAHALTTSEGLLAYCLGEEDAAAAFHWLRGLSFIQEGRYGLFPHDLAREVLEADLRWRNLERFREVHFQVRSYIIQQISIRTGMEQQSAIFALLYLHRNNPFMRPFFEWQTIGQIYIDHPTSTEIAEIEQMVLRHQGQESVAIMRYWYARQPHNLFVFRAAESTLLGFAQALDLNHLSPEDIAQDPAIRAAAAHLQGNSAWRAGDPILYFRNWMDREHYQLSPSLLNMIAMLTLRLIFTRPNLAYSFVAAADPEHYRLMFEYLRWPHAPSADFAVDGHSFGVFVHDWRAEPVLSWMEHMGERELLDEVKALDNLPQAVQPVALSEPEFAAAIREALKDVHRLDRLGQSPLLHSRLVRDSSPDHANPAVLQSLLRSAANILNRTPKDQKLYRVLWHTYFEPAPSQEAAAELLDLPFSTYRYQLNKGIERIISILWQQELYGTPTHSSEFSSES